MRDRADLPFPMSEYRARLASIRQRMAERSLDVFMCSTPENMYYLTGFNSRGYYSYQSLMIPMQGEPWMVTRHLDAENVAHQTWMEIGYDYLDEDDPLALTAMSLRDRGCEGARVGIEANSWFLTAATYLALREAMPDVAFVDASALVENQRMVKSNAEVEYIREAARVVGVAMRAVFEATHEGAHDRDLAAVIYDARVRAGSEYVASPVYVQTGPGSAIAHNNWNGRRIEKGDIVFFEFGSSIKRYHAACMRTAVIGTPSDLMVRADAATRDGLQSALQVMRPGTTAAEVDAACRSVWMERGFERYSGLRLGYHIGIGYPPTWVGRGTFSLNKGVMERLEVGMVFHVIPWLRIPGVGAIGNSETVLVTAEGAEVLTDVQSGLFLG
jgi:Xaa-Pro dipeptidase